MSPLKNILMATDLSGPARQAAERAARLASVLEVIYLIFKPRSSRKPMTS